MLIPITKDMVGSLVDRICKNSKRDPAAVAGRILEEAVELCAAAGLSNADILIHVTDALHNEALKCSKRLGHTRFPSQVLNKPSQADIKAELGDMRLCMLDMQYLVNTPNFEIEQHIATKFTDLQDHADQYVTNNGSTFYKKKDHVI